MTKWLSCILFIVPLLADDLVVHLPTDVVNTAATVYIAAMKPTEKGVEKTINEVLSYDFRLNGKSRLVEPEETKQFFAFHKDSAEAFHAARWKKWGVRYVIVPILEKDELLIQLFDVNSAILKSLHPIPLSKNLKSELHKAVDILHVAIFGTPGIASKRILYSFQQKPDISEDGPWHAEIWEMAYDGTNQHRVTEENHYTISPTFLPTKGEANYRFAYVTYKQGQPRIYMTSRNEPRGKPIVPLQGNQLLPTFSRTGDKIAFISDASGRADLFVQAFSQEHGVIGKPIQLYSFPSSVQASPSFSPDGKKIAFVSDKTGTPRVYIIDVNRVVQERASPELFLITKQNTDNTSPSWSPDGKKIAYSAKTHGVRQIWVYDLTTQEERQITTGLGNKENPSWASDSFHLVYNTTSPTYDIFLTHLNTSDPIRLTEGPGIKHYPAFEF